MAFFQIEFFSEILGMHIPMNVIIPQRARGGIGVDTAEVTGTYPTLYLLHGLSDDQSVWCRRSEIELIAEQRGIAVVMPTTHRGWYANEKCGYEYRKFVGEEVPKVCRSFFKGMSDKREDNYIGGVSMGGYGALALSLTYPERYSLCIPFSGSYDTKWLAGDANGKKYFEEVFGPMNEYDGSENDVFALAEKTMKENKPTPKIWMWCGHDDFLIDCNRKMAAHLESLKYDVKYTETDGAHGWIYWNRHLNEMFDFIDEYRKTL